ncbi:3-ketoacyl-ACP reductase [Algimonas arctica]|uniref:3-ketoacyl-ACP reductase n=1 Tax=Algimonas arctica TaxID=1479486 RepID=A0A8J3G0U4_9PROT|nr:SDR family oxidoreductase [Algimonas arctica]GHA81182.1 3-ketoacyl-ACP reductase [Algimonas arctica]
MTYDLSNKTAIVTGGSRGIGAAIATRLAADGAHVVLTYNSSEGPAQAVVSAIKANGGSAVAVKADASDPSSVAAYIDKAAEKGGIDILVHNAGIARMAPISEAGLDMFREVYKTNVDGVYAGTHAAIPHLNDGASIIVISSINSHTFPIPGFAIYGSSKAAVTGLVKGWARDLGHRNIRVNAIQPGPIDTDMNPADGGHAEGMRRMTALRRYGKSTEVAALAAFLASDESSFITGTGIDIDGGMTI